MKNDRLNDFQEKFLLFQECVDAWLSELNTDLLMLKASEKTENVGAKRHERESSVIPFPVRSKPRQSAALKPVA